MKHKSMQKNKRVSSPTPTVSVIIPSYNHEKFIKECLESVLNQSFQDFEIIITDDGSRDNTVGMVKTFTDPRIKLFVHSENKGACIAANNCLERARGRYIAMLSSDDTWYPEKLKLQVTYLEKHPNIAAVFGRVDWVDENGNLIEDKEFRFSDVFNVANRSRYKWLAQFFTSGNKLCHPSSLVRRECYDEIGMFNPVLANLPDLDLWIRICFIYEIHIMEQKFVRFRLLNEAKNISADNLRTRIRARFEYKQLLNHYLEIKNPKELLLIFPEATRYGKISSDLIPFFLGRIAIDNGQDFLTLWGLETIYKLIQDDRIAIKLEKSCKFTYLDFIKLSGKFDPFGMSKLSIAPTQPMKAATSEPIIIVRRQRLFLISSKTYIRNFVATLQALLEISKKYARDVLSVFLGSTNNQTALKLPTPTDKIMFSIDNLEPISDEQSFYRISGYAFLQEEPGQSAYERLLVLKSKTRTFIYPVKSSKGSDAQQTFEDSGKDMFNSVFSATLSRAIILPDIYTVGILFKHQSNESVYHAVSDKVLVHSAGQLQMESAHLIHKPQTSRIKSLIVTIKIHLKDIFTIRS